ncbi:MAG: hypothetical protein QOG00_256 [Pyrinomonadaceae bacterium]|nr:hypothetical protein [Pyrinomonadaceae bacterium]
MNDPLIHTEIFRDAYGLRHLMGAYLSRRGAIYIRDLGVIF